MSEIEKLRKRLKNVGRNVTQYNMTVEEAWKLAEEFEKLEIDMRNQLAKLNANVERWKISRNADVPQTPIVRNIDGGTF